MGRSARHVGRRPPAINGAADGPLEERATAGIQRRVERLSQHRSAGTVLLLHHVRGSLAVVYRQRDGRRQPGRSTTGQAGSIRLDRGPHRVVLEYVHVDGHADAEVGMGVRRRQQQGLQGRAALGAVAATVRHRHRHRLRASWRCFCEVSTILVVFAAVWCVLAWPIHRHETWIHSLAPYRRSPTAFYFLLTAACVGLALGPPYGLWQFVYWLPGFNMVRGSSRFMIVGLLGIAVLAGIGFDRISGRLARRWRVALATMVGVLLVAEYAAVPRGSAEQIRGAGHRSLAR